MSTSPRSRIESLPAYSLADLDLPGTGRVVQLAQNELAMPPSPHALRAAQGALSELNRYSDSEHRRLRGAIAEVHKLNPDRLVCGAGSMELMGLIASAYCESGVEVVLSQYGYKFFQVLCSLAGASLRIVPEPEMRVDIDAMVAAVSENTRIVFVVNPGNPTGSCLPPGAVRELRERIPQRVMLILDCAYAEFAQTRNFEQGFDLVDAGENIAVLRTFSKAYGLAGMRVGWCYAAPDVVESILKIRPPNSITTASLAAAEAAMRDRAYLESVCAEIAELRREFSELALSLGLSVLPSSANFVLIGCPGDIPMPAAELNAKLRENGIILRPMDSYDLPVHLRITIGSREEMKIAADVFSSLLK
jgi:histidinol-phosphate aminotransferase